VVDSELDRGAKETGIDVGIVLALDATSVPVPIANPTSACASAGVK
jgi:hypothetical protein